MGKDVDEYFKNENEIQHMDTHSQKVENDLDSSVPSVINVKNNLDG